MKAVGFKKSLPITAQDSFIDFEPEIPEPVGHELLVKIKAIGVNPVDYKIRQSAAKDTMLDEPKIIGWDACGVVEAIGDKVSLFKIGDDVYYAGDLTKSGCNATHQTIDERIVGSKPKNLSDEAAAAMPLTTLTAWEILFDRMRISAEKDSGKTLLIIGGAGGVGSIAIQLAKSIANLQVIATASRPETIAWCKEMGADVVVNHKDLVNEVRSAGYETVDFIADFADLNSYWDDMVTLIQPQGHIASISAGTEPIALNKLKTKSVSFSWEFMFTRPMFSTEDMIAQHEILNTVAKMIENGEIKHTLTQTLHGLSAANLKRAHLQLESGTTIGKLAIKY